MKKYLIALGAVVILGIAYYLLSPFWRNKELNDVSPLTQQQNPASPAESAAPPSSTITPIVVAQGNFTPKAHDVKGKAVLIKEGDNYTVRFEDFETINGPDVNIYLASDLSNKDIVDLGDIKATKGNVNYSVPAGTDTTKYNKVLVWCKAFSVLFSYAELK
jgi:hypothetical protein